MNLVLSMFYLDYIFLFLVYRDKSIKVYLLDLPVTREELNSEEGSFYKPVCHLWHTSLWNLLRAFRNSFGLSLFISWCLMNLQHSVTKVSSNIFKYHLVMIHNHREKYWKQENSYYQIGFPEAKHLKNLIKHIYVYRR